MPGLINIDASAITDIVGKAVDRIWPDKTAQQQVALEQEFELLKGQLDIARVEAGSGSLFVAGARPFLLWVCGISVAYDVVVFPMFGKFFPQLQAVDTTLLLPILMTLIGLRSWEKGKGVDTTEIK